MASSWRFDGTSSSLLLLLTMSTTSGFGFGGPATTATPFLFSCSAVLVGCAGWAWPPDICGRRTLRALEAVASIVLPQHLTRRPAIEHDHRIGRIYPALPLAARLRSENSEA